MLKLAPSFPVYMCVFSGVCVFACVSFLPLKASFLLANERPSLCRALSLLYCEIMRAPVYSANWFSSIKVAAP